MEAGNLWKRRPNLRKVLKYLRHLPMLRNTPKARAKLAQLPVGYPINKRGLFFVLLSNAWEKLSEEMTHYSTHSAGTGLCTLLLGLNVPLQMSHRITAPTMAGN